MVKKMVGAVGLVAAVFAAALTAFSRPARAESGNNLLSTESICMTVAACDGLNEGEVCEMCSKWADKRGNTGTNKGPWTANGVNTCGMVEQSECILIDAEDPAKGLVCDTANLKQGAVVLACPQKGKLLVKQAPKE